MRAALRSCGYQEWALKEEELRGKRQLRKEHEKQKGSEQVEDRKSKQYAVLPCMKGVIERLQSAFIKHDIALYVNAGFTIGNAVVAPRILLTLKNKVGSYTNVPVMYVMNM